MRFFPAAVLVLALGAAPASAQPRPQDTVVQEMDAVKARWLSVADDPITLRYAPRLADLRSTAEVASDPKLLEQVKKDFHDWKEAMYREKYAQAKASGLTTLSFQQFENSAAREQSMAAAIRADISRLAAQNRAQAAAAGWTPDAAGQARRFDGSGARSGSDGAVLGSVPAGPERYAKIRSLLLSQGVDRKVVDTAIVEGVKQGVDPMLVLSVVWKESGFRRTAHNAGSGATGLMQLLPDTAHDMGVRGSLYDVQTNIRAGVRYLKWMANDFFHMNADLSDVSKVPQETVKTLLAAYNAGIGNVQKWLRRQGGTLDRIPFAETRDYVAKIAGKLSAWWDSL